MTISRLLGALAAGFGTAVAAWVLGTDLLFATAWGLLVAGAVAFMTTRPETDDIPWPPEREDEPSRISAVARLAWAVNVSSNTARPHATRRVRALAEHWLDERGVSLHDPADARAVDALLGPGAVRTLAGADAPLDTLRQILTVISAPPADPKDSHDS